MTDPLRIDVDVACSAEHAFRTWTARIAAWWPADHTVSVEAGLDVVLQPRVGGRIYERTAGGVEHEWGEVTVWDPPGRLSYLWHLRRDRTDATEVDIRFVDVEPGRSRVEIAHYGWDRLGADGSLWRDRNSAGWASLVPHFVERATTR